MIPKSLPSGSTRGLRTMFVIRLSRAEPVTYHKCRSSTVPRQPSMASWPQNQRRQSTQRLNGDARVIIEWHTHVYPPEEAAASPLWGGRCPMTVENVLAAHHEAGLAVSVVSNAAHYLRGKDAAGELKAIARWSDYAAEIQNAHKGTLYCLAMATP